MRGRVYAACVVVGEGQGAWRGSCWEGEGVGVGECEGRQRKIGGSMASW
jgi:hypothetical protein